MIFLDATVLLAITVFGILVMLGIAKGSGVIKFCLVLLFGPVVLLAMVSQLEQVASGLPVAPKLVLVILSPLIVMGILGKFFPKANWSKRTQSSISNAYKTVLLAPFRAVGWAVNKLRGRP